MKLAVLGPAHTFTDLSADAYRHKTGKKQHKYYAATIDEVFELVEKGSVALGIVPLENKLEGTVRETLDGLFYHNVHIIEEITMPIHHCLVTLAQSNPKKITEILSHPQALSQCRKYLKTHFPKAELKPYASTTAALEKLLATGKDTVAVIASEKSGATTDLKILARGIEDQKDNSTRFVVLKKGTISSAGKTTHTKTSLAFHFAADSPGTLFSVLKDFADQKINLTKIESRPTRKSFGDYIFFVDFDGGVGDARVLEALSSISKKVAQLKVLGSYDA